MFDYIIQCHNIFLIIDFLYLLIDYVYLDEDKFKEFYLEDLKIERKMDEAAQLAMDKICLVRDFVHEAHERESLEGSWTFARIPQEVKTHILNEDEDVQIIEKSKEKVSTSKVQTITQGDLWDYQGNSSTDSDDDDGDSEMIHNRLTQPEEIDPMIINYKESSQEIAKRSVEWYRKVIVNSIDYLTERENKELCKALYANSNSMLWVLDQMPLMQYFVAVALRTCSVAGSNTAAETGIKWTKFYVNPERNRIKETKLNALNTIHERILQDDYNEKYEINQLQSMQICKTIIEAFDFTETVPATYRNLMQRIDDAKLNQSKTCM